jgi:hypothetical protein
MLGLSLFQDFLLEIDRRVAYIQANHRSRILSLLANSRPKYEEDIKPFGQFLDYQYSDMLSMLEHTVPPCKETARNTRDNSRLQGTIERVAHIYLQPMHNLEVDNDSMRVEKVQLETLGMNLFRS